METETKQRLAAELLEQHGESFDVDIPKALAAFFASGGAFNCEGKCAKLSVPGWQPGTFRLVVAPPSWEVASEINVDDAIVGEDGEWEAARNFVPLFNVDESSYIVAKIDEPGVPVGFFNEEAFREDGKGYKNGVFMIAKSLADFRESLVDVAGEADFECEIEDEIWDELDDDEDDDDEEDD
ncbi:MAG TPA: hypothetical protein VGH28_01575 [Polyangiaceae bacterium]|jgi:hypothetical protein